MNFLRAMLDRLRDRAAAVPDDEAPLSAGHQKTLDRADALLDDPRVAAILAERQRLMRDSFARSGRRLGR